MSWQVLRVDEVEPQPWRNGGGLTRELLAWPDAADWQVRISVADIAKDGPFSAYPGVERWFGVLQGEGVELRWPSATRRLRGGHWLLHFDGGEPPHCRLLGGPTRDINVMHRREAGGLAVKPARPGSTAPAGFLCAALFAAEPVTLRDPASAAVGLPALSLAWGVNRGQQLEASGAPHAWWIAFDPLEG